MTFPGASWWKMDLHAHTPAPTEFGMEGGRKALEKWYRRIMGGARDV